jgi:hypothetical protein
MGRAILTVAVDGPAPAGQLHAQLVLAASLWTQFEQEFLMVFRTNAVVQEGLLSADCFRGNDFDPRSVIVFVQIVFERSGWCETLRSLRSLRG